MKRIRLTGDWITPEVIARTRPERIQMELDEEKEVEAMRPLDVEEEPVEEEAANGV